MFVRLLLLFSLVPLVELALLVWIGEHTSLWFTLGLVIVTGMLGAALARYEGLRCLSRFQQEVSEGKLPADSLLDGLLILLAAALLVTPGVLTDAVGFALLIPPIRRWVRGYVNRRIRARIFIGHPPGWPPNEGRHDHDQIIDVKVVDPNHHDDEQGQAQ